MARETSRWRSAALQILKVGVSVGLLAWLFRQVDAGRLWAAVKSASWLWLAVAALLYFAMLLVSSWRWNTLLRAQGIVVRLRTLIGSFLVATFFNNFLPSNIGGDVVRVRDTSGPANSKTLAATVVLVDRGLGLLALVLVAALGRFASAPGALASSAAGAVMVQALLVAFYAAVARGLHIPVSPWHLAVMVPVSFIVQMIPISVNGFGVREATFVAFFALAGLGAEAAMLLSFMGTAVIMAWSLAGACVHLARRPS